MANKRNYIGLCDANFSLSSTLWGSLLPKSGVNTNTFILASVTLFFASGVVYGADPLINVVATPIYRYPDKVPASRKSGKVLPHLRQLANALADYTPDAATESHAKGIADELSAAAGIAKRIDQLNEKKPGDWDSLTAFITVVDVATKDSEKQSTVGNLRDANAALNGLNTVIGRLDAESKISDLKRDLEAIARKIRARGLEMALSKYRFENRHPRPYSHPDKDGAKLGVIFAKAPVEPAEIIEVIAGFPGEGAGLRQGDRVVSIDGIKVSSTTVLGILKTQLNGGREIQLDVLRASGSKAITVRPRQQASPVVGIDFDGSWQGAFDSDDIFLENISGKTLTDCAILVSIVGKDFKTWARHIHVVPRWEPKQKYHSPYYLRGLFAYPETMPDVAYVTIDIAAEQLPVPHGHLFSYSGSEQTADIQRYCKSLSFSAEIFSPSEGFFGDYHRGIGLSFTGVPRIQPSSIVVKAVGERDTQALSWNFNRWWEQKGSWLSNEESFRDARFDAVQPHSWEVELSFPDTSYVHSLKIRTK